MITPEQKQYAHNTMHNLLQWHADTFQEALNDYLEIAELARIDPDHEKAKTMLAGGLGILFLRGALAEYGSPGVKTSMALASRPPKPANG